MIYLFDWGNTLMKVEPHEKGPMYLWKNPMLCEHAGVILERLSRTHRCCLATNAEDSDASDIRKALERAGIADYITTIFCYRNLGLKKPDPAFFKAICTALSCLPENLIMVGDDPVNDYAWARENGAWALLYDPLGRFHDKGFDSISDLMELCPA
ncbi:MAG: HAD family hydrolase [Proteobacteria bacterium]|nr:HAD family hydrolase [Pseudomonadota bacterium]